MIYIIEVVQRNRLVKVRKRTPSYEAALEAFQVAKTLKVREARFFKQEEGAVRVLLKYLDKTSIRSGSSRYA